MAAQMYGDLALPSRDILHDHNLIKARFNFYFLYEILENFQQKNTAKYLQEELRAMLISLLNFDIFDFN